jgi:AAT family amino acid transporter
MGWAGIFSSLLIVVFSYGGSELIGMTITETKEAEKVLPKVINSVVLRVTLFYVLPIMIICTLTPWNQIGVTGSPFVYVFSHIGLPAIAHIMNFVMLTAVLSAASSGVYATSRMLYSLAQNKEAPQQCCKLTEKGVPIYGTLASVVGLIIGSFIALIWPDRVFQYLMGVPGFVVLHIWILICLTQLKLRPQYEKKPLYTTSWFPYPIYVAVITLFIIFIGVSTNSTNLVSTIIYITTIVGLTTVSFLREQRNQDMV